ncbi:hypothetical protein BGZ49_005088, partial [Haplosporangium sp. Z 27]
MAKGDIQTAPGTGHVGTLTPDQKELLKQMWAEIFRIQDGSSDVNESQSQSLSPPADNASIKSKGTVKKGWFGSKSSPAAEAEPAPVTRVNVAEIGLDVEKLRSALWNNVLGDHP